MPAPIPYNGSQSPLEYYALNGNVSVNGGLGRPVLITQTSLYYGHSFKNPLLSSPNDIYNLAHTNAKGDATTPFRGKSTGDLTNMTNTQIGMMARNNYNGGDTFDIDGGIAGMKAGWSYLVGEALGRKKSLILNQSTWGYSPDQSNAGANTNWYKRPDPALNIGQVII